MNTGVHLHDCPTSKKSFLRSFCEIEIHSTEMATSFNRSNHPYSSCIELGHNYDETPSGSRRSATLMQGILTMIRNILSMGMIALFVIALNTDADAARYRCTSHSRSNCTLNSKTRKHTTNRVSRYPRTRQIDGRSSWDLGKQNGQWPSF